MNNRLGGFNMKISKENLEIIYEIVCIVSKLDKIVYPKIKNLIKAIIKKTASKLNKIYAINYSFSFEAVYTF